MTSNDDAGVGKAPASPPVERRPEWRKGRPTTHGLKALRRTVSQLTTRRLDGRSAVAVAVRLFKADLRRDLGGDLTRAQETILELAAQTWVQVRVLDDWLSRQSSLVLARKKTVLPVLLQRTQLAEALAKHLDRLGLDRKPQDVPDLHAYLASKQPKHEPAPAPEPERTPEPDERDSDLDADVEEWFRSVPLDDDLAEGEVEVILPAPKPTDETDAGSGRSSSDVSPRS